MTYEPDTGPHRLNRHGIEVWPFRDGFVIHFTTRIRAIPDILLKPGGVARLNQGQPSEALLFIQDGVVVEQVVGPMLRPPEAEPSREEFVPSVFVETA